MINYPKSILIERYKGQWILYVKMYQHENGGCYYEEKEHTNDWLTGCFISLYPDGHLTYLFNGKENTWNVNWKEN